MAIDLSNNDYAKKLLASNNTPEEFKREPRSYYHTHNYAKFHFDLGGSRVKTISFANYRYVTDDKREQDQLDLVADQPGTFIYTVPENDVARQLQMELAAEQRRDVMKAAQAASAVSGQAFDPNTPVVTVAGNQPAGLAVVGMQNSLSGSQAVEGITSNMTVASTQSARPSAAQLAKERLEQLTAEAKASAT